MEGVPSKGTRSRTTKVYLSLYIRLELLVFTCSLRYIASRVKATSAMTMITHGNQMKRLFRDGDGVRASNKGGEGGADNVRFYPKGHHR